ASLNGGMTSRKPARRTAHRLSSILVAAPLVLFAAIALGRVLAPSSTTDTPTIGVLRAEHRGALGKALPGTVWPAYGQAAVQIGSSKVQAGPNQHAAPIASVAKAMTAYRVPLGQPPRPGEEGP